MYCLDCTWKNTTNLLAANAHHPQYPIEIRFGILTPETTGEPVIAMSTDNEDEAALSRDIATRIITSLQTIIARYDELTTQRDKAHQHTARRLVNAAVLTHTQWRAVLDGLNSANPAGLQAAIAALTDAAPPRWRNEE